MTNHTNESNNGGNASVRHRQTGKPLSRLGAIVSPMRLPGRMWWRSWPIRTEVYGWIGPASDARKWAESSSPPPRRRSGCWRATWARPSRRIVLPSPAFCRAAANAFKGLLPPLAERPVFTIRKRASIVFTLDDYVAKGILPAAGAEVIRRAVVDRKNILVAGGTGSGKTTLVNAILAEPPFKSDRIVLIEDTKELQCPAEDKVELLTKEHRAAGDDDRLAPHDAAPSSGSDHHRRSSRAGGPGDAQSMEYRPSRRRRHDSREFGRRCSAAN